MGGRLNHTEIANHPRHPPTPVSSLRFGGVEFGIRFESKGLSLIFVNPQTLEPLDLETSTFVIPTAEQAAEGA